MESAIAVKRPCMKHLWLPALFVCGIAHAEGPRIGLEYESERDNKTGMRSVAVTLKPGWEFSRDSLINLVELLIDHSQDTRPDETGLRDRETKLFVRLRHNRKLNESFAYYLRGGLGRTVNNQNNLSYAYIEPGLKYKSGEKWEWTLAYRKINSIDGTDGKSVRKHLAGPSYSLNRYSEIELRLIKGYGDKNLTSWQIGYNHKF
ncbi:MAG: hypothetical protein KF771_01675 [Burkholderiales bacterium]|nr:hypothetical protein [Burkholderiales bacterium]